MHQTPVETLSEFVTPPFLQEPNRKSGNAPEFWAKTLGQKSCRTKVPRIFRIFVPNFAPNFPRIFLRRFFFCFVSWETETRKIHQKSPPFFQYKNSQAKHEKKIFTECFLESRQSNKTWQCFMLSTGGTLFNCQFSPRARIWARGL